MSATIDPPVSRTRYAWARAGDVNAFFGLMLDNIGDMILMTGLLVSFGFPGDFVLSRMIPGTAVGVLVGDLIFTLMAFRLARKTRRSDVTAMPLGLDTPSTFGAVLLILGPAFLAAKGRGLEDLPAAKEAWFIGISMILASGIFKLVCSLFSGLIRRLIPRAGLLGSLTAIALVLISFLPLLDIASTPVAGMTALAVILVTLTARWTLPKNIPGALVAVVIGCFIYYAMHLAKLGPGLGGGESSAPSIAFRAILPMPMAEWFEWFQATWRMSVIYLPVAIPLALGTIVGGIDCTESAASAGDEYPTGQIIAAEGFATIIGGVFGGVIQSTPYIGHPAYKAMGAGAAYTLATALFIGGAGVFGYFDWIFYLLPKSVVFPILIFVGLEITSQSFQATPIKHYPAVALACVPALAYLAALVVGRLAGGGDLKPFYLLSPGSRFYIQTLAVLSGGFIVTSLLWGSILTFLIDGRIKPAVITLVLAGVCALFGVIHSPLGTTPIILPNQAIAELKKQTGYEGLSLRLLPPVEDEAARPIEAKGQIVVREVNGSLSIRIFDTQGLAFDATPTEKMKVRKTQLEEFQARLKNLWPPHELSPAERTDVVDSIASLVGPNRYEATKLQTPYHWAAAYWLSALLLAGLGKWGRPPVDPISWIANSD